MTEEYKENLLEYLTNNITFSNNVETTFSGSYDIVHEAVIDTSVGTSIFNFIAELLLEVDRSSIRINGMLQINNSSTKVIYGGYSKTDGTNTSEGFLILLDNDYNGIAMLRDYASGTRIREVQYLAQDEDNNIYGVVGDTKQTEQKYFTQLNNFTIQENDSYTLRLRKNYTLSDTYFRCIDITKKDGVAEYLIVGCDLIGGVGIEENHNARGINLKINVGGANEITRLYSRGNLNFTCYGIYSNYNDSGYPYMKVIAQSVAGEDNYIKLYKNINGTTSVTQLLYYADYYFDSKTYKIRQAKDKNGGLYFQLNCYDMLDYNSYVYALWYLDKNDNMNSIMSLGGTLNLQLAYTVIPEGWVDENNVERPFLIQYSMVTYEEDNETINQMSLGGIAMPTSTYQPNTMNNICNTILYPEYASYDFLNNLITLSNKDFNLLSIFTIQSDLTTDSPANVLTILKRPGLQVNKQKTAEMFQPKYVDIINDNEIKFSRNIYDSVVYSNISVDSVEVPYNYLNDMTIEGQNLYSEKNIEIVEDTTNWTKNRYENININFINKINVSNRDTSENLLSQAVSFNNKIHSNIDLNNGTATILYEDDTFNTVSVSWYPLTQFTYQATITINAAKKITGVDWTESLNGMQFITMFDTPLSIGSHTIKQKVTINNEFYKTKLLYNGVQVQYNGADVQVQSEEE